jgi:6-phospho-beta-glucosidase
MTRKLVFLGGGSPFIPSTFQAIIEHKTDLDGSEVCLFDLNDERLPKLAALGEVMTRRAGMDVKVAWTTDAQKALEGATFAFFGYRVGGVKALRQDFEIPSRYGICGDETAGPGGTFMAQCTIPATLSYCKLMEEICPDAVGISYVNPTNFVADAVRRESNVRFIAICDCFPSFVEGLAKWFGVPAKDVKARAMGVNHVTWLTELSVRGEDYLPKVQELIAKETAEALETGADLQFSRRIFDAYGYLLVCPGHPRMMWEHDAALKERKARWEDPDLRGWSARMQRTWDYVDELAAGAAYDDSRPHMRMHHARHAIGIASSIVSDDGREWGGMNFPNNGAIANLPASAIVEGHCVVDRDADTPVPMGDMPKPLLGFTQHILNWQDLTVDAALSGDKKVLYQALLASPYVHDMGAAKKIMDELLVAHADLMPQFKR